MVSKLLEEQKALARDLDRHYSNSKKDPKERKRGENYYQIKSSVLNDLWEEFQANHAVLEAKVPAVEQENSPYFAQDFHGQVRAIFLEYSAYLGKYAPASIPAPGNSSRDAEQEQDEAERRLTRMVKSQLTSIKQLNATIQRIQQKLGEPQPAEYYQVMLEIITSHWQELYDRNQNIWLEADAETLPGYSFETFETIENLVEDILVRLKLNFNLQQPQNARIADQTQTHESLSVTPRIKLPPITIPKFNGDYLKWAHFHDIFTQMVDKANLSQAQKMHFLRDALTGDAERVIKHMSVTDANYAPAWEAVQARFNNKRATVNALFDKLFSQPSCKTESATQLRDLHDLTQECLLGLKGQELDTSNWDPILIYFLLKKVDRTTHSLFEQSLKSPRALPELAQFISFLEARFQALEALGPKVQPQGDSSQKNKATSLLSNPSSSKEQIKCIVCKNSHPLYYCDKFLKMTPTQRLKEIKRAQYCFKCLNGGHNTSTCSYKNCPKCSKNHNKLLHLERQAAPKQPNTTAAPDNQTVASVSEIRPDSEHYVFLATAIVQVNDDCGNPHELRALLDSGSQINLISSKACSKLKLCQTNHNLTINGISGTRSNSRKRVVITLKSMHSGYNSTIEAYVIPKITSSHPTKIFNTEQWPIPKNIRLADPNFHTPHTIDLLLGAEIYPTILSIGQIHMPSLPILQNTLLGWVVQGKVLTEGASLSKFCGVVQVKENLNAMLERFWEIEEKTEKRTIFSKEEAACEKIFLSNTKRDSTGRYIVSLPFKISPSQLGESAKLAFTCLNGLEKKLDKNPEIKRQYADFLNEYINLGHMEEIKRSDLQGPHFFFPHHCVLKPDSSTTKLRVVFNGSAKTSSQLSLNDILMVGPKIQDDLFAILIRFRSYSYVFSADIGKMYRQILINPEHRNLQLIMWRVNGQIKYFRLNTVTYGTSAASYLATRCLKALAQEEGSNYSETTRAATNDFYVDDLLTGHDDLEQAIQLQHEIKQLLASGGFELRKWCANHPSLLERIPVADRETEMAIEDNELVIKALGLIWNPTADEFHFKSSYDPPKKFTKRTVASDIAKLFDPLGLLTPITIKAKIFLQKLWELKLDWDASLPQNIYSYFLDYRTQLQSISQLKIPRHALMLGPTETVEIHGFSDASEVAYGACIYLRTTSRNQQVSVKLLCSKSKVAPLKKQTLARLELNAAKLLAEFVHQVSTSLRIPISQKTYWTDSSIVISWISRPSSAMKTYVGNRVAAIQELTTPMQWRHVPTDVNPADLISRGMKTKPFLESQLWFNGPEFLYLTPESWPAEFIAPADGDDELKAQKAVTLLASQPTHFMDDINHGNRFRKLQRTVAFIIRFCNNCRAAKGARKTCSSLSAIELNQATTRICLFMQQAFDEEVKQLTSRQHVLRSSQLATLAPFLDSDGLIRVGGRLEESSLPYDAKHPIILPQRHPFTKLLMQQIHVDHLHVGPTALLSITRGKFWPLKGKIIAKTIFHECVFCFRCKPKEVSQQMGSLPPARINPSRVFSNCGVDFCGPFYVHHKIRGKGPTKAYVALFICMAVKAVHLEVVSELTTIAFLDALKRFVARRGVPCRLYCDNATNFMGARSQLQELYQLFKETSHQQKVSDYCALKGTQWRPIPPRSPYIGGIWEAGVKSAKGHLKKVLHNRRLTFEQLSTVIAEIEAVLNSRPLTALSDDPTDLQALTPSSFWNLVPVTTTASPTNEEPTIPLLTQWKLASAIQQEFWQKWSRQYLSELQSRYKWKFPAPNIQEGDLVLLKDENLPPLKWRTGRVTKARVGPDGLVRVVDLKTSSGETQRGVHKVCRLPIAAKDNAEPSIKSTSTDTKLIPTISSNDPLMLRNRPVNRNRPGSQPKGLINKAVSAFLLLTCVLPCKMAAIENGITIQPFERNPGFYFEHMGQVSLQKGHWEIFSFINLTTYHLELKEFRELTSVLNALCENATCYQSYCRQIWKELDHKVKEMEENDRILYQLPAKSNNRLKRNAPLGIIGSIQHSLFGVLDEEYAEHIEAEIQRTQATETELRKIIRHQVSITESTLNIFKKTASEIQQQFNVAREHVINNLRTLQEGIQQEKVSQGFNSLTSYFILIMSRYEKLQERLIELMSDVSHGQVNPLLFTPTQILEQISIIRKSLPSDTRMPFEERQDTILSFYQTMNVKARVTGNNIIIHVQVPLTGSTHYSIFKTHPVPLSHEGKLIQLVPAADFLCTSAAKQTFFPMFNRELQACKNFNHTKFLCVPTTPVFEKSTTQASRCEWELFSHHAIDFNICNTKKLNTKEHWSPLQDTSSWIFSLVQPITISVVCGETSHPQKINGSGIISIESGCVLVHNGFSINSHSKINGRSKLSMAPDVHIASAMLRVPQLPDDSFASNISAPMELNLTSITLPPLEESLTTTLSTHDVHHYISTYVLVLVILAIIISYYLKSQQCTRNEPSPLRRSPPVPAQRRHSPSFVMRENIV